MCYNMHGKEEKTYAKQQQQVYPGDQRTDRQILYLIAFGLEESESEKKNGEYNWICCDANVGSLPS